MAVELRGLTKRYGSTRALDGVDLRIESGQVHALLGHNGAGKSTLIKCLGGSIRPTSGEILLNGRDAATLTPRSAIDSGISIIHQHLGLIDPLTVAENLFLGREMTRGGLIRSGEMRARAAQALARVGADIDPSARVGSLSMGQRQLVAIAKALRQDVSLLVLDEPTAALSPVEAATLGTLVSQLRDEGLAVLYVTHLLDEVMALGDEVTVLRNGRAVWRARVADVSKGEIVAAISDAGTEVAEGRGVVDRSGEPALRIAEGFPGETGEGRIDVFPGEIVALYGLIGSGRTRLLESVFGSRRTRRPVEVLGRRVEARTPADALRAGIALVPADRARHGLFLTLTARENVVLPAMRALARAGFRSGSGEIRQFVAAAQRMQLRPPSPTLVAGRFSGGNQQKLLVGRWAGGAAELKVLLIDDPTQGVDVGARVEIYRVLRELARQEQMAILFSTNEPEEVTALADRVVLMADGGITASLDIEDTDAEALLHAIHPIKRAQTESDQEAL